MLPFKCAYFCTTFFNPAAILDFERIFKNFKISDSNADIPITDRQGLIICCSYRVKEKNLYNYLRLINWTPVALGITRKIMDIIKNVHMTHFLPEFVLSGAGTLTTVDRTENLASNAVLLDRFKTVK